MVLKPFAERRQRRQFKQAGKAFIADFLGSGVNGVELPSSDPACCWKVNGQVHYCVITANRDGLPAVTTRVNYDPPAALGFHLKSFDVRQQIGLGANYTIATRPQVTLVTTEDELDGMGKWLQQYIDNISYGNKDELPASAIRLYTWVTSEGPTGTPVTVPIQLANIDRVYSKIWSAAAVAAYLNSIAQAPTDS